ncbi:alpha/beta hydrolase [Nocardia arizonensis]|uniref:alpha/beta hydrolase n=1 Tax=Nocardia arizonensis TaxID=1141647 RepID=UPI0006D076C4|nr:alpha/beta hydrolase [Nocardia arizonensis]
MSKNLTVPQVLAWRPEALGAQATEWERQAGELRSALDTQWRAVDGSYDTWKGAAGEAMRTRFEQVRTQTMKVVEAEETAGDAARLGQFAFASARSRVESVKATAESKSLAVKDDGTCEIPETVKQRIYSSVGGDADRYSTAIAALILDADAQTAAMKQALNTAADADTATTRSIETAFANLPDAAAFGNSSSTSTPTVKQPPKNGTAEENRKYWDSLTAEEKALTLSTQPAAIGNLDGLPADVRDQANREVLRTEQARLQREVDTLTSQVSVNPKAVGLAKQLEDRQQRLADVKAVQSAINPPAKADGSPQTPRKLLMLDTQSGRQVRAAVAVGDPDNADHISVATPGLSTNARESLGGMVGEAETLQREAERQLWVEGKGDESVATVAWLGYDPPQKTALDIGNVAFEGRADEAAKPLANFYEGLDAASNKNDPHITALGHSYGSLATSQALQEGGNAVDDVVFYGSPGLGAELPIPTQLSQPLGWLSNATGTNDEVGSAADLGLQSGHVYEMTENKDPVASANAFGRSPNQMPWVTHLSTDEVTVDGTKYTGATGHSEYPRTDPSTGALHRSGYNLAAVVAGIPNNATNPNG